MTSNIQSRRAREQIIFAGIECPRDRGFERGPEFDDQFLALGRTDRHAACRRGNRGGDQAVPQCNKQLAPRKVKPLHHRANDHRVMWRINRECVTQIWMQPFDQR